ncbi:hypothetical protein AVEN_120156-1 [Araneus ventricosus]|uniref:Uncharacterized protein n=1 Tax=Araneus ventricosus TaxID=182803 RepID=A0A4Y2PL58_ARAVE|nr:hypothetical protein AVEN_120156-1 [Araneus ventricosus]
MDSSAPFPLFSSLRVMGDMNGRPFISPLRVPLMTTRPTAFSALSEQQPAEIRPNSIEVAWPVTAGLGVRVLRPYQLSFIQLFVVLGDRGFIHNINRSRDTLYYDAFGRKFDTNLCFQ